MKPTEYYKKNRLESEKNLNQTQRKINVNNTYRLVSFLSILGFLFGLAQVNILLAIVLSSASLVIFAGLVRYHVLLQRKRDYFKSQLKIVDSELDAINHIFTSFRSGDVYINSQHRFSHDLDLFGKGSLFQMLNRTVTERGEENLAKHISNEHINIEEILKLQSSIEELSQQSDLLIHFRTTGTISEIVKEDKEKIDSWRNTDSYITKKKWLNVVRFVFPSITLLSLLWLIITGSGSSVFIASFVINLVLTGKYFKSTNKEHNKLSSFHTILNKYRDLLSIFEKQKFNSEILKNLSEQIVHETESASGALTQLTKSVNAFDNRLNAVVAIFLEGLFLYDFHCLFKIESWRKKYKEQLPVWIDNLAQFDALVSLATFAYNNHDFKYPKPEDGKVISATSVGHPFIPASVRVANNFNISNKGEFVIVTGANMAGKSTFLRTVGVNLVLAMSGLPVCAENFVFTPRKLYSSMRTSDSLNENESYFYAELKRMKHLIDLLEDGEDLFIMLDEILKGTNSVDKQKGSQLALEKILQLKGSGIIATHDLALTEMEKKHKDTIKNQCFEIEIDNAKITFDYKLFDGVTQNMNAMLLMEQMGIIKTP